MQNIKTATNKSIADFLTEQGLYKPNTMLSVGNDAKTVKGEKLNYLTGILYLIPDYDLCPASKLAGCDVACLVSAGRGKFNSVINGRANKTAIYKRFPELFYELISRDIKRLQAKAQREGKQLAIRLNGTSDIDHTSFIKSRPEVQFYDYTKMSNRKPLANYHLTFSYSGASPRYAKHVAKAINNGLNVAVVFADLDKALKQARFLDLPVISGDDTDLRFLDYKVSTKQAIIALQAKGQAKQDNTGFVVNNVVELLAVA